MSHPAPGPTAFSFSRSHIQFSIWAIIVAAINVSHAHKIIYLRRRVDDDSWQVSCVCMCVFSVRAPCIRLIRRRYSWHVLAWLRDSTNYKCARTEQPVYELRKFDKIYALAWKWKPSVPNILRAIIGMDASCCCSTPADYDIISQMDSSSACFIKLCIPSTRSLLPSNTSLAHCGRGNAAPLAQCIQCMKRGQCATFRVHKSKHHIANGSLNPLRNEENNRITFACMRLWASGH